MMRKLMVTFVIGCCLASCQTDRSSDRKVSPKNSIQPTKNSIDGESIDDQGAIQEVEQQTPTSTPQAGSTCIEADETICAIEIRILELSNEARARSGLKPLTHDPKVAYISRDWSKQQAASGGIGHQGFPNQRISTFLQKFGFQKFLSAENVAYSSFQSDDVETIAQGFMDMWMNSPGHRRNILGNHSSLGVGIHRDQRGAVYGTQIFSTN